MYGGNIDMVVNKILREGKAGLTEAQARAILEAGPDAIVKEEPKKEEEVKVGREGGRGGERRKIRETKLKRRRVQNEMSIGVRAPSFTSPSLPPSLLPFLPRSLLSIIQCGASTSKWSRPEYLWG